MPDNGDTGEVAGGRVQVPAASRALRALRALAAAPGPVSAAALAAALELPRSTTYHLLQAMAREGFVVHLPEDRRWGLGVAAFEVGSAYLRHDPLERLAHPLLVRLVERAGSPVVGHLGVLHGRETLYLLKQSPARPVTLVTDVGVRLPAQLTATGRALLAGLPAAQVRALFPSPEAFVDRTGRGPRSLSALRRVLAADRARGWSSEDGEVTPGYGSVAAAAHDHTGRPVAALSLTVRLQDRPADAELAAAVCRAATELSDRLAHRSAAPVGGPARH